VQDGSVHLRHDPGAAEVVTEVCQRLWTQPLWPT